MKSPKSINFDDEFNSKSLSLSYKSFIISGFSRVTLTKVFSLIYIFLVARYIPLIIQDVMIIISIGQWTIGLICLFGFNFSYTRMVIASDDNKKEIMSIGISFLLLIGLPLSLLLNLGLIISTNSRIDVIVIFLISCVLYFLLQIVLLVEDSLIRSDRKQLELSIYSIANSVLVPLFFIFYEDLVIILIAWIICYLITFIYARKTLILVFSYLSITIFKRGINIVKYGLPIYASSIFALISQRIDNFLLYYFFPSGELANYYWATRLANIGQEIFLIVLIGIFPIFSKLYFKQTAENFNIYVKSLIKLSLLSGTFLFVLIILSSKFIIFTILSPKYSSSIIILQLISFAYIFRIVTNVISQIFLAKANRRFVFEAQVFGNVIRILLIFFIFNLGGLGFALLILIHNAFLSLYYMYRMKTEFLQILKDKQFILTLIGLISMIILLLIDYEIISFFIMILFFFLFSLTLFIMIKPIDKYDYEIIMKILPKRLKFLEIVAKKSARL